jgi:hypothetical protein
VVRAVPYVGCASTQHEIAIHRSDSTGLTHPFIARGRPRRTPAATLRRSGIRGVSRSAR